MRILCLVITILSICFVVNSKTVSKTSTCLNYSGIGLIQEHKKKFELVIYPGSLSETRIKIKEPSEEMKAYKDLFVKLELTLESPISKYRGQAAKVKITGLTVPNTLRSDLGTELTCLK